MASSKQNRKLKPLPEASGRKSVAEEMAELARQQREKASVARGEAETASVEAEPSPEPLPEAETESSPPEARRKVRPWVPAVGALFLVAGLAIGPGMIQEQFPEAEFIAQGVVSCTPAAEVHLDGKVLGTTPLTFELPDEPGTLVLKRPGFTAASLEVAGADDGRSRIPRYMAEIEPAPLELDWSGMPEVSKVIWQGQPIKVEELSQVGAGSYKLKVVPVEGPPLHLPVEAPEPVYQGPPNGVPHNEVLKIGEQVKEALAARPVLTVSIASPDKKAHPKPLTLSLAPKAGGKAKKTKITPGQTHRIVLTEAGEYKGSIAASGYQAWSQEWTLKPGQDKEVAVTLKRPVQAARPARRTSYAPRRYSGGGGGRRISAPSF